MKEEDIRPSGVFDEFLRLAAEDVGHYFSDAPRVDCLCPACGGAGQDAFSKSGFNYRLCSACETLYVSPRPVADAFSKYYRESASANYWASTFYRETAEARRQKLWAPKARQVHDMLSSLEGPAYAVVDIGGGYGIFAEEYAKVAGSEVLIIEPGPCLAAECLSRGLRVVEAFLETVGPDALPSGPRAFVSFELFEHLHSPEAFVSHLQRLMAPGDLFFFTTLSGRGLDIQVLWKDAKAVSPPHHLNFFNPKSIRVLFSRLGFEILRVETPGKLDMDILKNNLPSIHDRFWRSVVQNSTESDLQCWQASIAERGWSSHMLTLVRKI